ncbi:hypothetical protein HT031_006866 [Scenedesmus sp. PABB004]|nr:hypothetical protein HT031_006866 [Scenedesmus sp. PABB004]
MARCAAPLIALALLALLAAPGVDASGGARSLAQWWGYGNRGRYGAVGDAQLARNSASIVNTQYAIRSAVESGAEPRTTRAAAVYGNDQAWLAANSRWYGYGNGCVYGVLAGSAVALLLFRGPSTRAASVAFGTGFGAGSAWQACAKDFEGPSS